MFASKATKIVDKAASHGLINESETREYSYGLELLLTIAVTDITVLLIGFLAGCFKGVLIFWIIYKALRKYVGGFHFDNTIICYLSSCVLSVLCVLFVKYAGYNSMIYLTVMLISSGTMFAVSPVASKAKPLDEKEFSVFKVVARILVCLILLIYLSSIKYDNCYLQKIILYGCVCVTVIALVGKAEEKFLKSN